MFVLDVPALSLIAGDAGITLPDGADYRRRAALTATSEQSAPGSDDIRVWFDVPLADGGARRDWYFDCPIPTLNKIVWARHRPNDAVASVALSRALVGDVRDRLEIAEKRLNVLDLGVLAWLLLRIDEGGGEAVIDQMQEPTVLMFPGGTGPFVITVGRLRDADWVGAPARLGRTFTVRSGPRAHGEPTDLRAHDLPADEWAGTGVNDAPATTGLEAYDGDADEVWGHWDVLANDDHLCDRVFATRHQAFCVGLYIGVCQPKHC